MGNTLPQIVTLDDLGKNLRSHDKVLWLGSISYEERCLASLEALEERGLTVTHGIALNYARESRLVIGAEEHRMINWRAMERIGSQVCLEGIRQVNVDPYAFQQVQDLVREHANRYGVGMVVFDVTCMTKVHTLALASLAARELVACAWAIAYSIPENYGVIRDPHLTPGWRDIVVAPLAENAALSNEGSSRGLILTSHEGDRLIVALAEVEPSGGVVVVSDTPQRPDFRLGSEKSNQKVIRQLLRLRFGHWEKHVVSVADVTGLNQMVEREIAIAKKHLAPVILFPFGPKVQVFSVALQLCRHYPEASWFVYPVPAGFDAQNSEGSEGTLWLRS